MKSPRPGAFWIKDCALITLAIGRSASNLSELRDRVAEIPIQSLYHHFYESLLRPGFDDPEYRNDLAFWAKHHLQDPPLAERLAVIDPLRLTDLEQLRTRVLEVIEERLAELHHVPWARAGHQLHFRRSQVVVFDSGLRADSPASLGALLKNISTGSIYYHFIEARRRTGNGEDDFSAWLRHWGSETEDTTRRLGVIDFSQWSLTELRERVAEAFTEGLVRVAVS